MKGGYQVFLCSTSLYTDIHMFSRSRLLVFSCFCVLVLFGFGCKKSTPPPGSIPAPLPTIPTTTNLPTPPNEQQPKPIETSPQSTPRPEGYVEPEITYLRQVMLNLSQAKSFKTAIAIPSDQGTATGNVEFVKQIGLHGTLTIPGGNQSEVYILGSDIYFRANTTTWSDLSRSPEAANIKNLFESSLSFTAGTSTITGTARMISTKDDPSGCRLYTLSQYTSDENKVTFQICVKDDLPAKIISQSSTGRIEVAFREYNQFIKLESPIK